MKTAAKPNADLDSTLATIAKECLFIPTLAEQRNGSDFHEVSVWTVRTALEAAYRAGIAAAQEAGVQMVIRIVIAKYSLTEAELADAVEALRAEGPCSPDEALEFLTVYIEEGILPERV